MSIVITTDVFCDRCPMWTDGIAADRPKAREARANAASAGWVHVLNPETRQMEDVCPECQGLKKDYLGNWSKPE